MNISTFKPMLVTLLLAGNITATAPAAANVTAAAVAKETATMPATAAGVWQSIDVTSTQLAKTIRSSNLGEVHHQAFAIRDLVAALPSRSMALPADKQAKIKSGVKFVAILADRLDASGDANDKAATQANFEKLTAVLKNLRSNYAASAKN